MNRIATSSIPFYASTSSHHLIRAFPYSRSLSGYPSTSILSSPVSPSTQIPLRAQSRRMSYYDKIKSKFIDNSPGAMTTRLKNRGIDPLLTRGFGNTKDCVITYEVARVLMSKDVDLSYASNLPGFRDAILFDDRHKALDFKNAGSHADPMYCLALAWRRMGICKEACHLDATMFWHNPEASQELTQYRKAFLQLYLSSYEWITRASKLSSRTREVMKLWKFMEFSIHEVETCKELGRPVKSFANPDWGWTDVKGYILGSTVVAHDSLHLMTEEFRKTRQIDDWSADFEQKK
ncbi:hypothetical protein BT69DRAFT_1335180 [Atractiella rhizophila]|nr:hypothetical protein BT69DRAFT_1335180 [Atractiella rhizophila]